MDFTALPKVAEGNPDIAKKFELIARSLAAARDVNSEDLPLFTVIGEQVFEVDKLFTDDELKTVNSLFQLFSPFYNPQFEV